MFVGSCNGLFRALEKKTGKVRWTYDTGRDGHPVQFHTDPIVVDDLVITGSDLVHGEGAGVYAFDRATGKRRWKRPLGSGSGVSADVQRGGSRLYAIDFEDSLYCLDSETGDVVWKFAMGTTPAEGERGHAPVVANGRVYVAGADGAVYAIDAGSGDVVWKHDLGAAVTTSIALGQAPGKGGVYAGGSNGHVYRLDPASGSVTADFSAGAEPQGRLALAEDGLLVFFGEQKLACLDPALKSIRWSETASGPWTSSRPYVWRGAVVAGNERGQLFGLRLSDGARLWSASFEGAVRGIGSDEDGLYVGTIGGRVYAWTPGRP